MGKLTVLCCLATATCVSFFACQKNDSFESFSSNVQSPPSVPSQVVELTNQALDYQHFVTHQNLSEAVHPSQTLSNAARFVLSYFSLFEGEKVKTYTMSGLKLALIEAGLSEKDAQRRTERIFITTDCSPTYLTETAQLLSPILPPHTEGAFICELFKPYDEAQLETFTENTGSNSATKVLYKKTNLTERIKEVNRLVGVSGSITAGGDSQVLLYFNHSSATHRLEPQDIRVLLHEKHGQTEGEEMYIKLILGTLTEQAVWQLFESEILPALQKNTHFNFGSSLERIAFRYNYVEIMDNTGRLGYTIYDLDGFTN